MDKWQGGQYRLTVEHKRKQLEAGRPCIPGLPLASVRFVIINKLLVIVSEPKPFFISLFSYIFIHIYVYI